MFGAIAKTTETHRPAGGRKSTHGFTYQLSLLMYTFLRGLRMEDNFSLGAEVEEAGKFDDVVYRYRKDADGKGKRINRLLQQKHKSEQKNITLSSLLSRKSNSDFGLFTYFDSFLDIKENFIAEDEEIGDLLMYTNGVLKLRDKCDEVVGNEKLTFIMKDTFQEREEIDELLQTELYRFRKDTEERGKWIKYLMEHSKRKESEERVRLAEYLKGKSARMDREEREIFDKYLTEKSSRMDMEEKEIFEKYLTEKSSDKDREEFVKYLMKNPLGNDTNLENDVDIFLDKLSMAFNQPEIDELEEMVRKELMVYVNSNVSGAYSQFHTLMHNWLTDKKGFYLNQEDGLKLIEDLVGKYGRFKFGVDRPVLNFSGREKELEDLKKAFEVGKRVVICGLGGVGKTQLARKFAEMHTESYSCVLWMKSESYEDLEKSFKCLAFDRLGIKEKTVNGTAKDIASILNEVKEVLQSRKCLLIFDNIQYMVEGSTGTSKLDAFLRNLPEDSKLLMTSRRRDWENFVTHPLEPFSDDDATFLIRYSLEDHIKLHDEQVRDLAKLMQNFPLAIQQAIAYIKKKSNRAKQHNGTFGIDSYLTKFQENLKTFLGYKLQKFNDDDYFKTSMTTWDISMEDIRKEDNGELCEELFNRISYLFAEGISESDIIQCFRDKQEDDIIESLQQLDDYSMVNFLNNECSVHRLVQHVTRVKLKEKGEEEAMLDSLLEVCEKLDVRNVVSIWEHCAEHKELIKKHSKMPMYVIDNLFNEGRYADGYMYGKRLVQVMETILDPMDESMNEVNFALAEVTFKNGLHKECYDISEKVWKQSSIILGKEHRFTLRVRRQIAQVLYHLGRYDEWQDISKEVSEMCEKILGLEDGDSIIARVNYSECLRISGKLVESYIMIKEACNTCEKVLGTQNSDFNCARHQLAIVLMKLKRYNESLEILRNVWEWERNNEGEEHPDTLATRYHMGKVQLELCNYAESQEIFENVFECRRRILGKEHPDTLSTRHNMGILQFQLCNYVESLDILIDVYECYCRTLGEEHPDTLNTREWIVFVLKKIDHSAT